MRLLRFQGGGELTLTTFDQHPPPYAILSHTWGKDGDEFTFQDLMDGTGWKKPGYQKVKFCGQQAAVHGLDYFWVDTCCIDRSNNTELSEAINSMFRWYQNAAKCYAYLSDVPKDTHYKIDVSRVWTWEADFRRSRWFQRGWTLQELIAPLSVDFFASTGQLLGDKKTLENMIHETTYVPVNVLRGTPLSQYTFQQRFAWSKGRETAKEEDIIYSLLGIMNVYLPLIYGEGKDHAHTRLEEVYENRLRSSNPEAAGVNENLTVRPISTVPFSRDPDFVDRPEIIGWIHAKCAGPASRAALVGLGGTGKSQLAIQYSYLLRDEQPQRWVFWVHASSRARVKQAYEDIAKRLELPERDDPQTNIFQLVKDWLGDESNGQWTMIWDNLDDIEVLYPRQGAGEESMPLGSYLPDSKNGSILFTSRSKDAAARVTGNYRSIKEVPALSENQSIQLLSTKLQTDATEEHSLKALVHALGYIPLAIIQAAAYINRLAPMSISSYLSEFQENDEKQQNILKHKAADIRRDWSASNSIATTWQMSFEQIRQESKSAADLLSMMSFFNPQGIPGWVLRKYESPVFMSSHRRSQSAPNGLNKARKLRLSVSRRWTRMKPKTLEDSEEPSSHNTTIYANGSFEEDLALLRAYSLVTIAEDGIYEMHPLVRRCTQIWISSSGQEDELASKFLRLMAREFPAVSFANWGKCSQLLPHIVPILQNQPSSSNNLRAWCQLSRKAALYWRDRGNYKAAHEGVTKAAVALEKAFGPDDPDTLMCAEDIATILHRLGKNKRTEKILQESIQRQVRVLGEHHRTVINSKYQLAIALRELGKLEEAEKLHRHVFKEREKVLGERHPETLLSMSSIGSVLRSRGAFHESEEIFSRLLPILEQVQGPKHPKTLKCLFGLARALHEQERFEEAEIMYKRTSAAEEEALGKGHPETLTTSDYLAAALEAQSKYEEARVVYERLLSDQRNLYGEESVKAFKTMARLGRVLHKLKEYQLALLYVETALEGFKRTLGEQDAQRTECARRKKRILEDMAIENESPQGEWSS